MSQLQCITQVPQALMLTNHLGKNCVYSHKSDVFTNLKSASFFFFVVFFCFFFNGLPSRVM